MGVRYNAEKKKVGMYYSTPVYQFRMKCHLCDNHFEIKTDPANLDYEIISGARRQENRWDPTQNEQVTPETKEVQKRLFDDPMFKLEHGEIDKQKLEESKPGMNRLFHRNESVWKDCYEANSKLRAQFRKTKKDLKLQEIKDQTLLTKSSLDIELLSETAEDRKMAKLLRLHAQKDVKEWQREKRAEIFQKPILGDTITSFGGLKAEGQLKRKLPISNLGIVKKKAVDSASSSTETCNKVDNSEKPSSIKLVGDYGSSSESEDV